jgi:hypothetical protein
MRHVTPPDTKLLERDPTKANELLTNNPDYRLIDLPGLSAAYRRRGRNQMVAVYEPRAWQKFQLVEPRSVQFIPPLMGHEPIVFLGERVSPSGNRRLVVVAGRGINVAQLPRRHPPCLVLIPPSLFEQLPGPARGYGDAASGRFVPGTLQPGTADPLDASHISFDFDIYTMFDSNTPMDKGTLDAYLGDDDRLSWKVRDPATTQAVH